MTQPKPAAAIEITHCDCGCDQIYLTLYDQKGSNFAIAAFSKTGALGLAESIVDLVDDSEDTIGEVAGHA